MALYTRLIPNTNHWQVPSGPKHRCPDSSAYLFELKSGFGFEEWYRSPNFRKIDEDGINWQYGYWQCFKNPFRNKYKPGVHKNFTVYTRECDPRNDKAVSFNRVVAHYSEIEMLDVKQRLLYETHFDREFDKVRLVMNELRADLDIFDDHRKRSHLLNIRFKLVNENYVYSDENLLKTKLKTNRYGIYDI